MKVTEQHVAALKELIEPVDTDDVREKYRKGEFPAPMPSKTWT
ncbi:hypothetical protein GCM10020255_023600 [Rhodococcus baikonurensis]